MIPLTASRLREWPRIVAGIVVLSAVLLAVGLLLGGTTASSTTTVTRTVTSTVTRESPAQAAQIQADTTTIATLTGKLAISRRRLARAEQALRVDRRRLRSRGSRAGRPHKRK